MTAINLWRIREKIRRRFPDRPFEDREIQVRCLRQLWGWPDCNDNGVFNQPEEILIRLKGLRQWKAQINIAVAPNGWYAFSTDYWYGSGGGGYAPSVSGTVAFTTRDEVVRAAADELIDEFETVHSGKFPYTDAERKNALRMIEAIRRFVGGFDVDQADATKTAQLSLF